MPPDDVVWLLHDGTGKAYGPYHAKCAMLTTLAFQCHADSAHPHPRELQPELPLDVPGQGLDTRQTE